MTNLGAVRVVSAVSMVALARAAQAASESSTTMGCTGSGGWLSLGVLVFVGAGIWAFTKLM